MTELTIAALQEAYRQGSLAPTDVVEGCLARAREAAAHGVFITLTAQRALREARASQARWRAGRPLSPLDGVPVSWKDMIDVAGTATTGGSRVPARPPARRDAPVVARLARLGAVCIGKTNLSELAFSGLGLNPWYGTPSNPRGPAHEPHVCGGSSSGAAASVARQLCALAIGTDTSGSVRVPAAFTGLFGWKPGRRSWPRRGVLGLASSLDALGVIARNVDDAIQVHAALASGPAVRAGALARIVADERLFAASDEQPREQAMRALRRLERQGVAVELRTVPEFEEAQALFARHGTLVAAEAFARHRKLLAGPQATGMDPLVRQRLEAAACIGPQERRALVDGRGKLVAALERRWPGTAFAFPTTPITAPAVATAADPLAYGALNARVLAHTMVASFLDLAGMALPAGEDRHGLPTSLLLSAPAGHEDALLALCRRLDPAECAGPPDS
jgi:aspartyl-tRNA(Asn)/glutamyl-tRNA(Gln) amidotransferase subunit A